ncbi:asparagine synthase [Aquincola sp. S2]|uniref:asparagine synthase (glutamine-hydrolyzing) n=1 Tax=Pseudaquabacterium terrae TaxID=2732868 RepID=A0ABX2ECJ2_9BURK|nr:asparagine synthase C-terminal domain-containing protein [Aquabacterium terrae]NRF66517.1 asparagine synthase [Aquabacterium terrae]
MNQNDTPTHTALCLGAPRFADAALQTLAAGGDVALAWARLFAGAAPADALARVSGEFAVALREPSGRTVLAVDRFAAQTLCYRVVDGTLRFAERADALADASTPVDAQAIFDYLYFHVIPSPRTIFSGVQRLPAGHCAVFEHGKLTVMPYWVPEFSEPRSASFDALRGEFLQLLEQSVARELDGSKPACFLSGGTDSSTVAGMIGKATGAPADCYSIGFEAEGYDEMAYARIAAQHFGSRHHEYYVTPADLVDSIAAIAAHHDQPFGNSSALPAYYCAKVARADGVTKLLAGDGGDELFGGNSRYAKQRIFGWYDAVPRALRRGLMEPLLGTEVAGKLPLVRKGASYVEQARVPMPDRLQMYNLLRRLGMDEVLTPGFLARVDTEGPTQQQREVWAQARTGREINRMLAFDWRYTLAEGDLPKVRGSTQLAGIGVGYPLLDQALLDFSLRLPAEYKLKGLKLRWFFKEALRGFLPEQIITKRKQGFGLPFGVWVTRHAPLQRLATDALNSLATRGIVQPAFIRRLIDELLPAHPGYYGEMVWILTILEHWLQRHVPEHRFDATA